MLGPDHYIEMVEEANLEIDDYKSQIEKLNKLLAAAYSKQTGALLELEAHGFLPEKVGISF